MLMTCLSYAGKPEGRSERRTDMKPMKEIYLAGGCFGVPNISRNK